jgi:WD40 repeat protein
MAGIFRGQGRSIARVLLPALLFAVLASPGALAELYEQAVLVIDPGMHTAAISSGDVDAAGRLAVTGSWDKTLRVWSLTDGRLLRTIRIPIGPGRIGQVYAVAVHPDGALVAAAGNWKDSASEDSDYISVFETQTGKMAARIAGLPNGAASLAFSPDGHYLAAGLTDRGGLRVYEWGQQCIEVFRDTDYSEGVYGVTFSSDGRLATASSDGTVRLYDRTFKLVAPFRQVTGEGLLSHIAFSPDGALLAVGFFNPIVTARTVPTVGLLDGHSLASLPGPNVDGLSNGSLPTVTWSKDGRTLYAGGIYQEAVDRSPVLAWADAGRGARRALPAASSVVASLAALPDGRLFVATFDPFLELLERDGRPRWAHDSPKADFRGQEDRLAVSTDGTIVDLGFDFWGKSPLRFDLRARKLTSGPPHDRQTNPPKQVGLAVEGWHSHFSATLDGKPLEPERHEWSRSLAIASDSTRFLLGSASSLRSFDAKGRLIWRHATLDDVWAVNISGDGRLAIAAYGDGTIRWHRMDDGRELLALHVLADKQNWVAWTPEGFYDATAAAFGVLQWQVNRGFDTAPDAVPVNKIPQLRRPDALPVVLQELEITRALGIADLKAARRNVQIVTGSSKAPGARLHVLTIGISDYGDKARNLRLNFAARDAQDVASALLNTQGSGLYAEVKLIYLPDRMADKHGITDALAAMNRNMAGSSGQDLAVVMFSGHGAMFDNQFYLVPYGADTGTMEHLKSDSIPAADFRSEIEKLAQHGRVLVLLDACRSAELLSGGATTLLATARLRSVMNAGNVTVLTSSSTDKVSREYDKWGHGAFTKALLDALSASDEIDSNHDGVISMSELSAYIGKHLTELTDGDQQLGVDQRFLGDIFVAGL